MPKIFLTIMILMRLNTPAGYLLVFFPALFGLFLAYRQPSDLMYVLIFFMGSVLARSAGCIINDLFDRDFDKKVKRTKHRPLASNKISQKLAFFILILLLSMSLLILLSLSVTAISLGIIAFCMMILYPLMKRFTYFPQVFLGLTFNLGCLIGYATVQDDLNWAAILMYVGCGFWTFGYDTIYAFMDLRDDKKAGVKSSALLLENRNYKLWVAASYICFILLYIIVNLSYKNYIGITGGAIALPLLLWQVQTLNITNVANCSERFKSNIYVGAIMALGMFLGIL